MPITFRHKKKWEPEKADKVHWGVDPVLLTELALLERFIVAGAPSAVSSIQRYCTILAEKYFN